MANEKCPFCNKPLNNFTEAGKLKHIARCKRTKPKYIHTGNPCGRPREHQPIKSPKE